MPVPSGEAGLYGCGLAFYLLLMLAVVGCGPDDNPLGIGVSLDPSDVLQASAPPGGGGGGGVGPPTVTSVSPEVGTTTGNNTIVVTGSNFASSTTVTIGGRAGTVTFINGTTLNVVVPQNPVASDTQVVVANSGSPASTVPTYTYVAAPFAYATLTDAAGTYTAGSEIRVGNFNGDNFLDVVFVEGLTQIGIATNNGSGLLTKTPFPPVVPLATAASRIDGIAVGVVNGGDAIAFTDSLSIPTSEVRVLFKSAGGGGVIDTERRNSVIDRAEDVAFDPDNPRLYVTKIPITPPAPLLEVYNIDATGTLSGPTTIAGTFGDPSSLAVGTRENNNVIEVTDSAGNQVRLVRVLDRVTTNFTTTLTSSDRSAATQNEDGILVAATSATGNIHVITEDLGNTVVPLPLAAGGPITGLAAGDVNGDGRPDVVVTRQAATNGQILAFLNGGFQGARLRFSAATMVGSRTFSAPEELVLGNFNADGQIDIVLFTDDPGTRLRALLTP